LVGLFVLHFACVITAAVDLTKLKTGTTVTFSGTTTFGYKEWEGPLISVAGTSITITGTGTLDGLGAKYWDGEGSNGGKSQYPCLTLPF
jgi:polygalacturonase